MSDELGKGYQGHTYIDSYKGQKAIYKTVPHPNLPGVASLQRWMIQREGRALKILNSVDGVPELLGIPDRNTLALEFFEGRILRKVEPGELTSDFFQELEELIRTIHLKGIVHSDLKKKDNIMIDDRGNPVILDFGTHFAKKENFRPLYGFLYNQFKQMDLNAISKLRENFCPNEVRSIDRERLNDPTIIEKIDRFRRDYLFDF